MTLSHLVTIAEYEIYPYHLISLECSLQNMENEGQRRGHKRRTQAPCCIDAISRKFSAESKNN